MKFNFQKVLPKARRFTPKGSSGCPLNETIRFKLKNVQSRETMHKLKAAGYVVEGEVNHENNTTFGMVRNCEHIIVTDSGDYPFHLGDTTIRLGYCTTFRDAPIVLR
jgi:hypothetical protein